MQLQQVLRTGQATILRFQIALLPNLRLLSKPNPASLADPKLQFLPILADWPQSGPVPNIFISTDVRIQGAKFTIP